MRIDVLAMPYLAHVSLAFYPNFILCTETLTSLCVLGFSSISIILDLFIYLFLHFTLHLLLFFKAALISLQEIVVVLIHNHLVTDLNLKYV